MRKCSTMQWRVAVNIWYRVQFVGMLQQFLHHFCVPMSSGFQERVALIRLKRTTSALLQSTISQLYRVLFERQYWGEYNLGRCLGSLLSHSRLFSSYPIKNDYLLQSPTVEIVPGLAEVSQPQSVHFERQWVKRKNHQLQGELHEQWGYVLFQHFHLTSHFQRCMAVIKRIINL